MKVCLFWVYFSEDLKQQAKWERCSEVHTVLFNLICPRKAIIEAASPCSATYERHHTAGDGFIVKKWRSIRMQVGKRGHGI